MNKPTTITEYISSFPDDVKITLEQVRKTIAEMAPDAEECINYGIPTFKLNGNLVHFAGYKNHIGFYPAPSGIAEFKEELSIYKGAKGSVQFPLNAVPYELIKKITAFRVAENLKKK